MAGGFLILTFAFPSLSLGLPTSTREGLTGVIPKVSDSVLPGQSPVTPCPQSPAGSCDSAARGSGGPPAPPTRHTQRASCYHGLPRAERVEEVRARRKPVSAGLGGAQQRVSYKGWWLAHRGARSSMWAAPGRGWFPRLLQGTLFIFQLQSEGALLS